jgi:hypothetical protein
MQAAAFQLAVIVERKSRHFCHSPAARFAIPAPKAGNRRQYCAVRVVSLLIKPEACHRNNPTARN